MAMTDRCGECGAPTTEQSCEELFHRLLALDHQRDQPWASFHAINVACYLLQHPSTVETRYQAAQLKIVSVFCDEGPAEVQALTAAARSQNSHRASTPKLDPRLDPTSELPAVAPSAGSFTTTIHDVAVDGTFPADGYGERVQAWAQAVRVAWSAPEIS